MKTFVFVLLVSVMMPFAASAQIDFKSGIGVPYINNGFGMAVGDFDGNGQQDVVFTAYPNRLIVYYSIGTDLIQKTFNISASKIAVGDFNGDSNDDLMIIDTPLNGSPTLKKSISTGTDFNTTDISTLEQGSWNFEIYDHDEDGNLDLLLMKKFDYLKFYKGDGAGNFQQTEDSSLPYASDGSQLVCGDFNNDNKIDILIKGYFTVSLYVKNSENEYDFLGEFDSGTENPFAEDVGAVVADFNGDNSPDVVVMYRENNELSHVLYYENNGAGQFAVPVELAQQYSITKMDHGDYDNDGNEDLIFAVRYVASTPIILHNLGNASFEDVSPTENASLTDIAFVNIDGSGEPEIIGLSGDGKISVFKFNGSAYEFDDEFFFATTAKGGTIADLDNDGLDDVVVSSWNGVVTIWYGKGEGEFEEPVIHKFFGRVPGVATADFNGDGYGDIALSAQSDTMEKTFVMLSEGARQYRIDEIEATEGYEAFVVGDFNNDENMDFTAAEKVWINNGDETFTSSLGVAAGYYNEVYSIDKGHFNNDEFLDLAVGGDGGNLILYNDGAGSFTTFEDITGLGFVREFHTADLNNDGLDDLITFKTNSTTPDIILLTRTAEGGFDETHLQSEESLSIKSVNTADIDGDGLLDIVVSYTWSDMFTLYPGLGVFRGKIEGGYEPILKFDETIGVNNLTTANWGGLLLRDIDKDLKPDVVIISINGSPVTTVLQEAIKEPTVAPTISATGESSSAVITLGPGNGNGRLLVVRKESSGAATAPDDNTIYELNAANGDVYVLMTSTQTTLSISDLEPNSSYVATAFEYTSNSSQTIINYFPTAATAVFSTRKYQVINVTSTNSRPLENAAYTIEASSSAGLPLTYNLISGNGSLSNNIYTPTGAGLMHIEIIADGNADYEPTSIEFSQCIFPLTPVISIVNNPGPVLTSSANDNNFWEHNGSLIANATNKTYTPDKDGVYRVVVNIDGCQSYSEFTPFITTGLEEETNGIALSPNPATDVVLISNFYGEPLIYNSVGKSFKVPSTSLSDGLQLNTSDLQPGLYIVRVRNASMKFIKQ